MMRRNGLVLGCLVLVWVVGMPLAWGQGKTSVQLESGGTPELRSAAEESASAVITEINRAAVFEERPNMSDIPVTARGRKSLMTRWEKASFYCNQTELTRSLVQRDDGMYEIRDIPLIVGDEQRSGVLVLNAEGQVRGFRYSGEVMTGTVTVLSEPSGATVVTSAGDTSPQTTPAQFEDVPEGQHEFTIQKESYQSVDTTLAVTAGQTQRVSVRLEPERAPSSDDMDDGIDLKFGVKGGLNRATFGGDNPGGLARAVGEEFAAEGFSFEVVKGARSGFAVGGFAVWGLSENFALQPEVLYVQKGQQSDLTLRSAEGAETSLAVTTKLDYVEVPVLARLQFPVGDAASLHLLAGPALGFNTTSEFEANAEGGSTESSELEDISGTDIDLDAGLGVDFHLGAAALTVETRYHLGVSDVPSGDNLSFQNRGLMVAAGIAFQAGGEGARR